MSSDDPRPAGAVTVCIQCSMRALLDGHPPPVFDETPGVHQQRMHPYLYATYRERQQLEQQLYERGLVPRAEETP